ncbi:MAG: metallophosphoesterase [Planctomycetaceae bacterium]|jgi:Icc-related predicted phosphoesterase|nr:metallophosphoesterase [Planctomycetaceae bacterium]
MKNISRRNFLITTGISGIALNMNLTMRADEADLSKLPRFAVISDTHFENKRGEGAKIKVPKALKNLLSKKPTIDAIFVVGDLTNRGTLAEYEQLVTTFNDKNLVPKETAVYFMMGYNHDRSSSNTQEAVTTLKGQPATSAQRNYLEKTNQPLHQYVEIKGYPFITISEGGSAESPYNNTVKQFLAEKLEDAAKKYAGKPIFVFTHVPPLNTCYGSLRHEGWGTNVFLPILNQYPQAIVFSGHSHFPVGDPRSIHQDKFTTINVGSTTYSEVEPKIVNDGIHPDKCAFVTEGVIANVLTDGKIEIERWDTYRDEEILPRWTINAPHDGNNFTYKNRDGLPAPVFAKDAKPIVRVEGKSCHVTFPQAVDNEVVHHYIVEILSDEQVIASFSKFSMFYLNSATPKELTVTFKNLPEEKILSAQVKAIDSYKNQSQPIKSETFTITK